MALIPRDKRVRVGLSEPVVDDSSWYDAPVEHVGDFGAGVARGTLGVADSALGLVAAPFDIINDGRTSQALRPAQKALREARASHLIAPSERHLAASDRAYGNVDPDASWLTRAGQAAYGVATEPGMWAGTAGEMLPSMAPSMGAAAAAAGAARARGAVDTVARESALRAAAGTEGALTGGRVYAEGRYQRPNAPVVEALNPAIGAGLVGAAIPYAGGRVFGDVADTALAGVGTGMAGGRLRQAVQGVLTEAPEEGLAGAQEQAFTNVATGRPVGEGTAEAFGTEAAFGGLMGGALGALRRSPVPAAAPVAPPVNSTDPTDLTAGGGMSQLADFEAFRAQEAADIAKRRAALPRFEQVETAQPDLPAGISESSTPGVYMQTEQPPAPPVGRPAPAAPPIAQPSTADIIRAQRAGATVPGTALTETPGVLELLGEPAQPAPAPVAAPVVAQPPAVTPITAAPKKRKGSKKAAVAAPPVAPAAPIAADDAQFDAEVEAALDADPALQAEVEGEVGKVTGRVTRRDQGWLRGVARSVAGIRTRRDGEVKPLREPVVYKPGGIVVDTEATAANRERMVSLATALAQLRDTAKSLYDEQTSFVPTASRVAKDVRRAQKAGIDEDEMLEISAASEGDTYRRLQGETKAAVERVLAAAGGNEKVVEALVAIMKSRTKAVESKTSAKAKDQTTTDYIISRAWADYKDGAFGSPDVVRARPIRAAKEEKAAGATTPPLVAAATDGQTRRPVRAGAKPSARNKPETGLLGVVNYLQMHGTGFEAMLASAVGRALRAGKTQPTLEWTTDGDPRYDPNTDTVYLNPEATPEVALHEALHAALQWYVTKNWNGEAVRALRASLKKVLAAPAPAAGPAKDVLAILQKLPEQDAVLELISYGTTLNAFRAHLKQITALTTAERAALNAQASKGANIRFANAMSAVWKALTKLVQDFLGVTNTTANDVLDNTVRLLAEAEAAGAGRAVTEGRPLLSEPSEDAAIVRFFKTLAKVPGVFQNARITATTLPEAMRAVDPAIRVQELPAKHPDGRPGAKSYVLFPPGGGKAYVHDFGKEVQFDASKLLSGMSKGSGVYQALFDWADNTGKIFEGDSRGISVMGAVRRMENMISSALKHDGNTTHMRPHEGQVDIRKNWKDSVKAGLRKVGFTGFGWATGADEKNLAGMLRASYAVTKTLAPEIEDVKLDEYGDFVRKNGDFFTDDDFARLADEASQRLQSLIADESAATPPRVGIATLKRAALFNTVSSRAGSESGRALVDRIGAELLSSGGRNTQGVLYAHVRTPLTADVVDAAPAPDTPFAKYAQKKVLATWLQPLFEGLGWNKGMDMLGGAAERAADIIRKELPGLAKYISLINARFNVPPAMREWLQRYKTERLTLVGIANEFTSHLTAAKPEEVLEAFDYLDSRTTESNVPAHVRSAADDLRAGLDRLRANLTGEVAAYFEGLKYSEMLSWATSVDDVASHSFGAHRLAAVLGKRTASVERAQVLANTDAGGAADTSEPFFAIYQPNPDRSPGAAPRIVVGFVAQSKSHAPEVAGLAVDYMHPWKFDSVKTPTAASGGQPEYKFRRAQTVREAVLENRRTGAKSDREMNVDISNALLNTVSILSNAVATRRLTDQLAEGGQQYGAVFDDERTFSKHFQDLGQRVPAVQKLSATEADSTPVRSYMRSPSVWVQVPDSKAYGALAGKIINGGVWTAIQDSINRKPLMDNQVGVAMGKTMRLFKRANTVYNIPTHVTNFVTNATLAYLHNISAKTLGDAGRLYLKYKLTPQKLTAEELKIMSAFTRSGAVLADYSTAEIKQSLYEGLGRTLTSHEGGMLDTVKQLAKWEEFKANAKVRAAKDFAMTLDEAAGSMYAFEDNMYRLAAFLTKMGDLEVSAPALDEDARIEEAGAFAKSAFLDYDIDSRAVQLARQSVLPFISWTYAITPVLMRIAKEQPWKIATLAAIYQIASTALLAAAGEDSDEDKRNRARDRKEETTWGAYRHLRLPILDDAKAGTRGYLDAGRFIPMPLSFKDAPNGFLGVRNWPSALTFGGPFVTLTSAPFGIDPYTGRSLYKNSDSNMERMLKVFGNVAQQFTPNMVDAVAQGRKVGATGYTPSGFVHAAKVFGVPVSEVNVREATLQQRKRVSAIRSDFAKEISRLRTDARLGRIDKVDAAERIAELLERRKQWVKEARGEDE